MLTRALRTIPLHQVDARSEAGVFLRRVRIDLTDQLGGPENLTPAQALLIDEAARTALIARATGEWITAQQSLVRQDASLLPAVLQRETLVGSLTRILLALGLERRAEPAETLDAYLARRAKSD